MESIEQTLFRYRNVDLTDFTAPNIVFHQATKTAQPQVFQFDPKRIVYDKDLSVPNMQGTRQLTAKHQLPDTNELVDLYIETPLMQTQWGISRFDSEITRNGKVIPNSNYSLQLSFRDIATKQEIDDFYKAMFVWDQEILTRIFANKQKWLPGINIKSVDALEPLFSGVCTPRQRVRDGQLFPPTLMLRIPKTRTNEIDVTCVDKNGQPFDLTSIKAGTDVRAIFKHRIDFKAKSIEVKNQPVLVQVNEVFRPTTFTSSLAVGGFTD